MRSEDSSFIGWYLVESDDGQYHVIPVRRHALFFNRCKLCVDQIVDVPPDTTEMEITTKAGLAASTVLVGRNVAPKVGAELTGEMELRPKWYGNNNFGIFTFGFYFFTGLALSLTEAFLWNKIRT